MMIVLNSVNKEADKSRASLVQIEPIGKVDLLGDLRFEFIVDEKTGKCSLCDVNTYDFVKLQKALQKDEQKKQAGHHDGSLTHELSLSLQDVTEKCIIYCQHLYCILPICFC